MAGIVPPHQLEEIRAASDIVEVVGSYIPLKKAGANFVALCPFHREKTPSFNVNPARQIFHCFGCQKGGDVFTFVQEYERLTFPEALRRLAERAHIELEFTGGGEDRAERNLRDRLRELHEALALRWHRLLKDDPAGAPGREYLAGRGVSAEAVRRFRLGYAPNDGRDLLRWLRARDHDPDLAEKGGLLARSERDGSLYGRFRGRLMFPICDPQGRVVGFSGRLIEGDAKRGKYVNSPETPIFRKSRVIYGLDKARQALLDAGQAVLCEGQLDLIACHLAGIENVVAPQGTALTADHCRLLRRYVEEVVLCFDSDTAGQKAALRSLDDLLASGLAIKVATVPAPHDPDSFIREHGGEAFRKLLAGARGFFDFLLDQACATNDLREDRGRTAVARAMAENVLKTGNPVTIDAVIRRTAERLGLSVEAVRQDFRGRAARARPVTPSKQATATAQPAQPPMEPPSASEFWLLRILLTDDNLVPWAAEHLEPEWVRHPAVREVVRRRLQAAMDDTWSGVAALLHELADPGARQLVTQAVAQEKEVPNPVRQLMDIVARLELGDVEQELRALKQRLAVAATLDRDEVAALQKRSLELVQRRFELRQQFSRPH